MKKFETLEEARVALKKGVDDHIARMLEANSTWLAFLDEFVEAAEAADLDDGLMAAMMNLEMQRMAKELDI